MRLLEKMAVKIGGGSNHRMGLYDMIMIKDNHVDYAGGIEKAIETTQAYLRKKKLPLPIEIEARNLEEVKRILAIGQVNRIMLDNFSVADTKKAVEMIDGKYETEASGGINLNTIRSYAECGVDYVSVGAITHSVKSLDMSLKAIEAL
jgi:nicotinate-nucleotide pyrophosphorylase (carboxylating)